METTSYTIQQIAEQSGLSVHTLRYYEKIGLLQGVLRDSHGYRQYSESDRAWIEFLIRLRATGMGMAEMRRFAELRAQGPGTVTARRELLEAHRLKVLAEMEALMRSLSTIEDKIGYYKGLEKQP